MNNQNKEINETIKRTKRYWYVDGFAEIAVGILLMILMLFNQAVSLVNQQIAQIILRVIALPALIILGGRAISRIVSRLKEKYTYPRTGYVSYQPKDRSQRWKRVLRSGIAGLLAGTATSLIIGNISQVYQYLFVALLICLAYVYVGYVIGLNRFYMNATVTLAMAAALILLDVSQNTFFQVFFFGQGLIWVISGSITLCNYLQATQPPLEGES